MRSRSSGSAAAFLASFSAAICAVSSAVRSRIVSRNFAVCACSSSSLTDLRRSPISLISSTIGWTRFRSRSCRVPNTDPIRFFSIPCWTPLPVQPPTLDVSGHRLGHEPADGLPRSHSRPYLRRRDVHAPRVDRSSTSRHRAAPARPAQHDHFGERRHLGRLAPLRQRRRRVRSKEQDQGQRAVRPASARAAPAAYQQ